MTTDAILTTLDVALPTGAVLRLGLARGAAGEPPELVFACGHPGRTAWHRLMAEAVNIPAGALPALRDALACLAPAEGAP